MNYYHGSRSDHLASLDPENITIKIFNFPSFQLYIIKKLSYKSNFLKHLLVRCYWSYFVSLLHDILSQEKKNLQSYK